MQNLKSTPPSLSTISGKKATGFSEKKTAVRSGTSQTKTMMNTIKKLERKKAPSIVDAVHFNLQLKPYSKLVLRNGVEVYTIEAGPEDVMSVEWVYYAGNWYED